MTEKVLYMTAEERCQLEKIAKECGIDTQYGSMETIQKNVRRMLELSRGLKND